MTKRRDKATDDATAPGDDPTAPGDDTPPGIPNWTAEVVGEAGSELMRFLLGPDPTPEGMPVLRPAPAKAVLDVLIAAWDHATTISSRERMMLAAHGDKALPADLSPAFVAALAVGFVTGKEHAGVIPEGVWVAHIDGDADRVSFLTLDEARTIVGWRVQPGSAVTVSTLL